MYIFNEKSYCFSYFLKIARIILYSQIQLLLFSSIRMISSGYFKIPLSENRSLTNKILLFDQFEKNIGFPLCKNLILDQIGSFRRDTLLGLPCISLHVLKQANTCFIKQGHFTDYLVVLNSLVCSKY